MAMDSLVLIFKEKVNTLRVDCVCDGLLLTDIGDILLSIEGDLRLIKILYLSQEYDKTFDLIIDINNTLSTIDEIVYPDLLLK